MMRASATTITGIGTGTNRLMAAAMPPKSAAASDRVADQDPDQGRPQEPARVVVPDDVEQALAADLPELGGQVDDRIHHREGDGRGPQERRPELRPGAGVGADRRGVVVAGACDDAEAE